MEPKELVSQIKVPIIFLVIIALIAPYIIPVYVFGISIPLVLSLLAFTPLRALAVLLTILPPAYSGYLLSKNGASRTASGLVGAITIAIPSAVSVVLSVLVYLLTPRVPIDGLSDVPAWFSILMYIMFLLLVALADSALGFALGIAGNYAGRIKK
jgi:hypothetical protein